MLYFYTDDCILYFVFSDSSEGLYAVGGSPEILTKLQRRA